MKLPAHRHIPVLASAVVFALAYAFGLVSFPHFGSIAVLRNLMVDNAFLAIAAAGATLVIIQGGIDLSVGSLMAFTSVSIASLVELHGWHPAAACFLLLVVGALFGAAQGAVVQCFRVPAFLVTLAGLFLARGGAFAVHPQSIGVKHPFVAQTLNESMALVISLPTGKITLPCTVPLVLIVLAIGHVVLGHTRFGRGVHALGDDEASAVLMGQPVARTRIIVYAVSGLLSAMAGVVFLLYQQSGDPAACKGFELDAIAAVVIGGTLLRGGVGSMLGTAIGVAILGMIQTLITFQGDLSSWWTRIIVGALVLAFVAVQRAIGALATKAGVPRTT